MKYAIIENEEVARQNLLQIIERIRPEAECVFMADSVAQSVKLFSKKRDVDLVFIDIELDDSNCFDIFRQCEVTCPVIFATAYDEYA